MGRKTEVEPDKKQPSFAEDIHACRDHEYEKAALRARIASDVAEYVADGGEITICKSASTVDEIDNVEELRDGKLEACDWDSDSPHKSFFQ